MDTAQLLVTILGAGGGGAAMLALVNGVIKWLSGAASRERDKNTDLIAQRRKAVQEREAAEKERDDEAKKRRKAEEYSAQLRRQLIESGVEPEAPAEVEAYTTQERIPTVKNRQASSAILTPRVRNPYYDRENEHHD